VNRVSIFLILEDCSPLLVAPVIRHRWFGSRWWHVQPSTGADEQILHGQRQRNEAHAGGRNWRGRL